MFENVRGHTVYTPGLGSSPVVLDLGAHRAEFTREMHARYGGRYYLVEANPALAGALSDEGVFPVWHCAVTDADGSIEFNIAQNDTGSSVLTLPAESVYNCVFRERVRVRAATLRSLLAEIQIDKIDLLKMDIEGAEVDVIRSLSPDMLRSIGQITVEFHSDPVFGFDLRPAVEDAIEHLTRNGFVCLDFSARSRIDVLLVNQRLHAIPWSQRLIWRVRTDPPAWLTHGWHLLPRAVRSRVRHALQ